MQGLLLTAGFVASVLVGLTVCVVLAGALASVVIRRTQARLPVVVSGAAQQAQYRPRGLAGQTDVPLQRETWDSGLDPAFLVLATLLDDFDGPRPSGRSVDSGEPDRSGPSHREPEDATPECTAQEAGRRRLALTIPAALRPGARAPDVAALPSGRPMAAAVLFTAACVVGALVFATSTTTHLPRPWSLARPATQTPNATAHRRPALALPSPWGRLPRRPEATKRTIRSAQALLLSVTVSYAPLSDAPVVEDSMRIRITNGSASHHTAFASRRRSAKEHLSAASATSARLHAASRRRDLVHRNPPTATVALLRSPRSAEVGSPSSAAHIALGAAAPMVKAMPVAHPRLHRTKPVLARAAQQSPHRTHGGRPGKAHKH